MRHIIIHKHLFKNGGSTIDWALKKNFGKGFYDHRDDKAMIQGGADYLEAFLEENQEIVVVSSHHMPQQLPERADWNFLVLAMFRHPIERIASVYTFEKKQNPKSTPGAFHANKYNLEDYVLWRCRNDSGPTIRDFYTRCFQPVPKKLNQACNQEDLAIAMQQVEKVFCCGCLEEFDLSMVVVENFLLKFFPEIDLSYVRQNTGISKGKTFAEKMSFLTRNLTPETFLKVFNSNQCDIILYEYVRCLFYKKLFELGDTEQLLMDFQTRCKKQKRFF